MDNDSLSSDVTLVEELNPASIATRSSDQVLVLERTPRLEDIGFLHAAALRLSDRAQNVVVDCGRAEHLDACTLQLLLAFKAQVETSGGAFRITGQSAAIDKYLAIAGLSAHFAEAVEQR